jgi:hypothetical protein
VPGVAVDMLIGSAATETLEMPQAMLRPVPVRTQGVMLESKVHARDAPDSQAGTFGAVVVSLVNARAFLLFGEVPGYSAHVPATPRTGRSTASRRPRPPERGLPEYQPTATSCRRRQG